MSEAIFTKSMLIRVTPEISDGFKKLAAMTMSKSSDHYRRAMMFYLVDCGVLSLDSKAPDARADGA
jgi:hypothetical protein